MEIPFPATEEHMNAEWIITNFVTVNQRAYQWVYPIRYVERAVRVVKRL